MNPFTHGITLRESIVPPASFTERQLANLMYNLRADADGALLLESCTHHEADALLNPGKDIILEAVTAVKNRLPRTMQALVRTFKRYASKVHPLDEPTIGPDRRNTLFAYKTVTFTFTDGQTVSILFHSPGRDPKKLLADDVLIAYRWLLNRRDITATVAPENGRDIDLQTMARRIIQLLEANSEKFVAADATRKAETQAEADLNDEHAQLSSRIEHLTQANAELSEKITAADRLIERLQGKVEARGQRNETAGSGAAKVDPTASDDETDAKRPQEGGGESDELALLNRAAIMLRKARGIKSAGMESVNKRSVGGKTLYSVQYEGVVIAKDIAGGITKEKVIERMGSTVYQAAQALHEQFRARIASAIAASPLKLDGVYPSFMETAIPVGPKHLEDSPQMWWIANGRGVNGNYAVSYNRETNRFIGSVSFGNAQREVRATDDDAANIVQLADTLVAKLRNQLQESGAPEAEPEAPTHNDAIARLLQALVDSHGWAHDPDQDAVVRKNVGKLKTGSSMRYASFVDDPPQLVAGSAMGNTFDVSIPISKIALQNASTDDVAKWAEMFDRAVMAWAEENRPAPEPAPEPTVDPEPEPEPTTETDATPHPDTPWDTNLLFSGKNALLGDLDDDLFQKIQTRIRAVIEIDRGEMSGRRGTQTAAITRLIQGALNDGRTEVVDAALAWVAQMGLPPRKPVLSSTHSLWTATGKTYSDYLDLAEKRQAVIEDATDATDATATTATPAVDADAFIAEAQKAAYAAQKRIVKQEPDTSLAARAKSGKILIAHVWDAMQNRFGLSFEQFKALVAEHRLGLRAGQLDMKEMIENQADVKRSETPYMGSEFYVINVDDWEARGKKMQDTVEPLPPVDLNAFAQAVKDTARSVQQQRSDDEHVQKFREAGKGLIAHVWDAMQDRFGLVEIEQFKALLAQANNQSLLRLSRADLSHAFPDQSIITRSEASNGIGTWHFIQVDEPSEQRVTPPPPPQPQPEPPPEPQAADPLDAIRAEFKAVLQETDSEAAMDVFEKLLDKAEAAGLDIETDPDVVAASNHITALLEQEAASL